LAERTGVPAPTIHYYRRLGLLPEPEVIATNRFLYDDRHVEVLAMIRLLREERQMSLASIADVLPDLLPHDREEAFRPEMWDRLLSAYLEGAALTEAPARLLTAAREAFAQHGYSGVNIADICESAGIATGSFYRHFKTKDAIFVAAVNSVADVIGDAIDILPARMSNRRATAALGELLQPFVTLLLESALRERRGAKDLTGAVARVGEALSDRLQSHLQPSERSCERAHLVVHDAMTGLFHLALGLAPLESDRT
jgi:AcrR family transcriptional regulator